MAVDRDILRSLLRDIPDFPQPGILFKDITPLLGDPAGFRAAIDAFEETWDGVAIDKVAAVEARGFFFAAPLAERLGVGLIPIRKAGKLPWKVVEHHYDLEYGTDSVQAHQDAAEPGERVLVIDDVLATGGTAAATCALVEQLGAEVVGLGVLLELGFLDGRARLEGRDVRSVLVEP
ncbi:MAG: adenine phosphoribosyltransferase [Actinomycetota bacterium]|nr:adenine phosphoribosyltransferase [Actinomycetota bacterium]